MSDPIVMIQYTSDLLDVLSNFIPKLIAFASKFIFGGIMRLFTKRTKTILDDLIVQALTGPIFAFLIAAEIGRLGG